MCFLAGMNGPRHWLLASNSDNPYTTTNHLLAASGERHSYLAVRVVVPDADVFVPWAGMLTRGVNAAGLGFTYAFVPEQDMADHPAQEWSARMLATASTVEEGLTYLTGDETLPGNYLFADRSGGMAVVEVGGGRVEVRPPATGTEARANGWRFLAEKAAPSWDDSTASTHRQGRGSELLGALDTASPEALRHVLRDHREDGGPAGKHGRSLCNHGTTDGTISSEIIDPSGHLWFGFGFPCGSPRGYEQDSRTPWGRLVRFSLAEGSGSGDLTTADGTITPLGVRLMS
ncbi:peptidase C45 acyl-coenzyme A:6- aminopenicillanic acid acyl-transferase [Amycolatopsis methanolica 239]|uniref:Peptidase C45 acyl-coenzyme A:6-aminopenicillanic acid acyl-transferase n=2 Tax=Amycolatopsis methanolica TaxID=1814 RepID=A0A076MRE3_AMYME|nr:peptidase C45 acyl-coenzyme A:6- aminopenicillanic acid acyl-transferase [Amycolatopsis methanolica 239]